MHDTKTNVTELSQVEKLAKMRRGYIRYPRLKEAEAAIDRLFLYGNLGADVKVPARCMLLTSEPGGGKSTLLQRKTADHPPHKDGNTWIYPVLYVEVPSICNQKTLAQSILRALNVPESFLLKRGNENWMTTQAVQYLRDHGVRLLILDEFQHMLKGKRQEVIKDAADYVKHLLNAAACPILLSGTDEAVKVYQSSDGSLARRSFCAVELPPFDWSLKTDRESICYILSQYQRHFPVPVEVNLYAERIAYRILLVAKGNFGRVADFVFALAVRAVHEGKEKVGLDLLRRVAYDFRDLRDPRWRNPFDLDDAHLKPVASPAANDRETSLSRGTRQATAKDLAA